MNQCSFEVPLCYGTVFSAGDNVCWFKNNTFTYQANKVSNDSLSTLAVPKAGALNSLNTDCPYKNGSLQTSSSSENFTIHCNADIVGNAYSPISIPEPGAQAWHATSMAECMEF